MMQEKYSLLKMIRVYSFAVLEAALFLDTHPSDEGALEYYDKYSCMLREATEEYEEKFGPLTINGADGTDYWSWVRDAWPWEYEANCTR